MEDLKISKDLIESVFNVDLIKKVQIVSSLKITQIRIWNKEDELYMYSSYDIYHFADMCKKWAFKRGYEIIVLAHSIKIYKNHFEAYNTNTKIYDLDMFFKACEWILKNEKNPK